MRVMSVVMTTLLSAGTVVGGSGAAVAKIAEDRAGAAVPWGSVSATCSIAGKRGSIRAYYQILRTKDYFNRFNWHLSGGGLGNRSNIEIRVVHNRAHAPDRILFDWNSSDSVRKGSGGISKTVRVLRRDRIYITARFVFDRWGPDVRCKARSKDI